tara:strand:- start:867 stop:1064 length:198 start_codon:yes stop_codon:yes gene_type:complete
MDKVTDKNNLIKTLRNNPKSSVIFGEFKIKYWKDEKETIYSHEYLVYENLSNSSIHNIELITKPA